MKFYLEGDLYQFLCLCFGLVPAPYVFTKLLKITIAFLRRIGTLIIIYLDDMLLIRRTAENVQVYRHTVILLLQKLGFLINLKKSVMNPSQEMEFLGMVINSKDYYLSSRRENPKSEITMCRFVSEPQVSILQLTKVLGHLTSTITSFQHD